MMINDLINPYTAMTCSDARKLLLALEQIKANPTKNQAICPSLLVIMSIRVTDITFNYLKIQFTSWKDFSGSIYHPVPVRFNLFDRATWTRDKKFRASRMYIKTDDYWSGSYGKKRKELLDYLIVSLEHDINCGEFVNE